MSCKNTRRPGPVQLRVEDRVLPPTAWARRGGFGPPGHLDIASSSLLLSRRHNCPPRRLRTAYSGVLRVHNRQILLTLRGPAQVKIRRYPRAPDSPPVALMIESFRRQVDIPVAGDPLFVTCVGCESDGALPTVTTRVMWDGLPTRTFTSRFRRGTGRRHPGSARSCH